MGFNSGFKGLNKYADSGKNQYSLFCFFFWVVFCFCFSAPAGICECKAEKQNAKTKQNLSVDFT